MSKFCLREAYRLAKNLGLVCMTLPPLSSPKFREHIEINWYDQINVEAANLNFHLEKSILKRKNRSFIIFIKS